MHYEGYAPMMKITRAEKSEAVEISRFLTYVWQYTFHSLLPLSTIKKVTSVCFDPELLASQIENTDMLFLAAKGENAAIVGVTNAVQGNDAVVYVNRLYVHPDFQGQGIGSALLDKIAQYFPSAKKMSLEVVENNAKGVDFYTKRGFKAIRKNQNFIADVILDVIVMEKELNI